MKRSPDFKIVAYMIKDKSRTEKEMNKISTWPHTSSCIQYLAERKQWQNKTFYLGLQLCFTKVWDYKEIFPGKARWKTQTRVIYLAFKHLWDSYLVTCNCIYVLESEIVITFTRAFGREKQWQNKIFYLGPQLCLRKVWD